MRTALLLTILAALCFASNGGVNIPTAGTAVRLSSTSVKCVGLAVQAAPANSGKVCIGTTSGVTCTLTNPVATTDGPLLNAGDNYAFVPPGNSAMWDLSQIWVVATANTSAVRYLCQP